MVPATGRGFDRWCVIAPMNFTAHSTDLPLLYSYRRCPYAMRARMALLQAGVAFDVHDIVLRDKPARMLALSPKGTVPVLVLPDGTVIDQSLDIMAWAFAQPSAQGGAADCWTRSLQPELQHWLALCDGPFKHDLDRYKYPERFGLTATDRAIYRDRAMHLLLEPMEQHLQQADQLGGSTPCAADMAIFPFVRQFAAIEPKWFAQLALPALQRWFQGWTQNPIFVASMTKTPINQIQRFHLI
jgi:glutathione S-transferase